MCKQTSAPDSRAYQLIRAALEETSPLRDTGSDSRTACPVHDGEDANNFSLYPSGAGRCWSTCGRAFKPSELAAHLGVTIPTSEGVTVDQYLAEFNLPAHVAGDFELRNGSHNSRPCVVFPHLDEHGDLLREQRRLSLHDGQRFVWKGSGGTNFMFGLQRLAQIRKADFCLIVEGASDVLCSAAAKVPALGVPGSGGWKKGHENYLRGISKVGIWLEPGEAGKKFVGSVASDVPSARVLTHTLAKDPAELFKIIGPTKFRQQIEDMWKQAPLASEYLLADDRRERGKLHSRIHDLLDDPALAELIECAIRDGGFVGDVRPAMVVYMTIMGRLLRRPPHLKLLGPPGSGKNAAIDAALDLFPPSSFLEIDAASGAYLIYSGENLVHRALILTEMDSLPRGDTNFASFQRSLIDKGRAVYRVTVEGQPGESRKGQSVLVEGPVAFITTGIRDLESQAHSRMLTQPIDDDPDRVRAVTKIQAKRRSGDIEKVDVTRFQDLQRYLELSSVETVVVPFWDTVVDLMPDALFRNVRQNRDADQLLAFIESFALLYQDQRIRDPRGRVVATLDDYRRAVALLEPLFRLASSDGVTSADREAYDAVQRLQVNHPSGVSNLQIAEELGRARSTISSRVSRLQKKDLLKDLSQKKYEHFWIVSGSLPDSFGLPPADLVIDAMCEASVANSTNTRTENSSSPAETHVFEDSPPYPVRPEFSETDDVLSI
jgi:hypothetical protein